MLGLNSQDINKLQMLQNNANQIITGARKAVMLWKGQYREDKISGEQFAVQRGEQKCKESVGWSADIIATLQS